MAKRITSRDKLAFKLEYLTDSEIDEVMEYVAIMESLRSEQTRANLFDDELVASLSAAYENQKAQQALEWEAARRRPMQQVTFR